MDFNERQQNMETRGFYLKAFELGLYNKDEVKKRLQEVDRKDQCQHKRGKRNLTPCPSSDDWSVDPASSEL
jgi:hypothetical protein